MTELFGGQTMVAPLRRVLVRAPHGGDAYRWPEYGWRAAPDPVALAAEHEALCDELERAGAEVVHGAAGGLDAIYVHDPAFVCDAGAIVLRPGKAIRLAEADALAADLETAGVPLAARLEPPAVAEGGDLVWLDERTLLAGRGYRTNDAGIDALRAALPGVDVVAFDLVHHRGPGEVFHLMSFLSMLDRDLAACHPRLAPVRLLELLRARGVELVEVPGDEVESLGPNILALAPRVALAAAGNPETRRRLERAGVDVRVYPSRELTKGDGGPTCLTRPLLRR